MKTENAVLMQEAKQSLTGNWGVLIGATVVYILLLMIPGIIPGIGYIATLALAGPLQLGLYLILLEVSRNQQVNFSKLFWGFNYWWLAVKVYFLVNLFTFLWTLLLIIPGLIAGYSYAMTFFIIADNPTLGARQAITMSKEMMMGNKWKLFYLSCRFIGWSILCLFTFGIGFLWLMPYMYVTFAKFYDDLKKDQNPVMEMAEETPGVMPMAEAVVMPMSEVAEAPVYEEAQTHFPDMEEVPTMETEPRQTA